MGFASAQISAAQREHAFSPELAGQSQPSAFTDTARQAFGVARAAWQPADASVAGRGVSIALVAASAHFVCRETLMGTPADYTIIVLLVAVGVGLWTALDRLGQLQRDVDALRRRLGADDGPSPDGR